MSTQEQTVFVSPVMHHNDAHPSVSANAKAPQGKEQFKQLVDSVCDLIAPTWPLDRMIAVNPYWGRRQEDFDQVARELAALAGSPMTMPAHYYQKKWAAGDITQEHLVAAIKEKGGDITPEALIQQLDAPRSLLTPAPLLSDVLDGQRDLPSSPAWCDTITHQIAQFCAAYFDQDESQWCPDQSHGLYATWRQALTQDHSVALLMKAGNIPAKAKTLAHDPLAQIQNTLAHLNIDASDQATFLQVVLLRLSGWAAWCAYCRWQAGLKGTEDNTIIDLLAIRLSWEHLIDDDARHQGSIWSRWHEAWHKHFTLARTQPLQNLLIWQRAHELSYQWALAKTLSHAQPTPPQASPQGRPAVQAAFCIDVRSEVFRRHLEQASEDIQTLGFAGFFGLPISYTPLGTQATRPQLPGLLAPTMNITDSTGNSMADKKLKNARAQKLGYTADWLPFQTVPASAFSLVETLGLSYFGKLIRRSFPRFSQGTPDNTLGLDRTACANLRPCLDADSAGSNDALADIALKVLTGMTLTTDFARLVLLIGHGSQTQNNAQKAGLDCGACCGQTGEVNARALASLLNNPSIRAHLKLKGIDIPATTLFLAGLHNTTTDEVTLYDAKKVPNTHQADLIQIQERLAQAGDAARQERAAALDLTPLANQPDKLLRALQERARDWAQTRPEWGLANNAAFIIASRGRTRGTDLAGRSFLHEYDPTQDPDGAVLEQIMTAPMIVTNWINLQYFASTVDNHRYGSGNKTLHNVVGGRLGVFEGNGGDLRIGLAKQSVHNGQQWCHNPLRLTVVIDATQQAIERIIHKHPIVKDLVHNQWLYLARFNTMATAQTNVEFYHAGQWRAHHGMPST